MKVRAQLPLAVLFVGTFAAWWGISAMSNASAISVSSSPTPPPVLAVHHHTEGGQEIYDGSLMVPGCATLSTGISRTGSYRPHVSLQLSYEPRQCSGSLVEQEFSVAVSSVPGAVQFNGVSINGMPAASLVQEN